MVLRTLGYGEDNPILRKAEQDFLGLEVHDPKTDEFRMQPCLSPIWDCAITAFALSESGIPKDDPRLQKAGAWIISKEVTDHRGDWKHKNPTPITSGWAFEFSNKFYPDVDDTFKVLLALGALTMPDEAAKKKVMQRALDWAVSFQCKNGGFAAFDKDVTKKWLQDVPFADHNAILDPPCSDITARALEVFGRMGYTDKEPFVRRAVKFVRDTQLEDGSWEGPLGRELHLRHVAGAARPARDRRGHEPGLDPARPALLESCQNADGGWGETCAHLRKSQPQGPGRKHAVANRLGAHGHHRSQRPRAAEHGPRRRVSPPHAKCRRSWTEDHITGTGFPKVFYLKYDMYRNNWPLWRWADFRALAAKDSRYTSKDR